MNPITGTVVGEDGKEVAVTMVQMVEKFEKSCKVTLHWWIGKPFSNITDELSEILWTAFYPLPFLSGYFFYQNLHFITNKSIMKLRTEKNPPPPFWESPKIQPIWLGMAAPSYLNTKRIFVSLSNKYFRFLLEATLHLSGEIMRK